MFSRLLQSARGLLTEKSESEARLKATRIRIADEGMVKTLTVHNKEPAEEVPISNPPTQIEKLAATNKKPTKSTPTQNKVAAEELTDENTINVYVPTPSASTRQRKRGRKEALKMNSTDGSATPSAKKRKVLPVRAKEMKSNTYPVVEIPLRKISLKPEAHLKTPAKKIEVKDSEDEEEDASPTKFFTPMESIPKKHKRFGSEEVIEEPFSTAPESSKDDNEKEAEKEDSEESDDEAPEVVGMQEAAKSLRSKEQETAKAVKEQLSATRKKRRQKDDALKKQAASGKKRRLEVVAEELKAPLPAEAPKEEIDATNAEDEQTPVAIEETEATASKQISFSSRSGIPELLPTEYLQDDDSDYDMILGDEKPKKKGRKTNLLEIAEKQLKDRRIGTTTYRVTKTTSTRLAPKASTNARLLKETWLQGRASGKVNPNRRIASKGFFKK